ncbi:MAG: 4Fe-4S binding protein [Prevotellaceae bacterium]|jgi:2-oxoglutarate ferredoxin oxidoreductase subunit delta|nr:4Fe-4S binding protein [Prevotellaceae bacterium]
MNDFDMNDFDMKRYVQLDTGKCKACWKCQEVCPRQVIGKINIIIHKHALMKRKADCIGCLKCVEICPYGAFNVMTIEK